jgi:hypothetical protein
LKLKSEGSKGSNFQEYLKDILTGQKKKKKEEEVVSDRSRASMQASFGFVVALLTEMKSVNNGSLLIKALEHFLSSLSIVEPGSFMTGDKYSFILDANLNEARKFLVDLIQDKTSDKKVIILSCKVLLMLGLARSSVEDFLILC